MRYGSVCSGIEAASVAWEPLGWHASFLSEIDAFPRAVLKHHYPDVHLHGDFTTIQADQYEPIDLLVGGTPCQSFSVAGLRGGLADERGNLALEYLRLASRLRPRWVLWENVPGVLSSNGGRDFGAFLGGLEELGYGWSYRTLDAQYFGLAQRRKRVFVVGYLGDWRRAAAVLFEPASLRGHPAPRREKGEGTAPTVDGRIEFSVCFGIDGELNAGVDQIGALQARPHAGNFGTVAHSLRAEGHDASEDGTGRGVPLVPVAFGLELSNQGSGGNIGWHSNHAPFRTLNTGTPPGIVGPAVRRLTVEECEALQGFPRGYTNVPYRGKPAADGPRYKALGNSMAVPVMRWIGRRIAAVDGGVNG